MIEKSFGPGSTPGCHLLDDEGCGIDPEAGGTQLQPEAHHLGHLGAYGGIGPVEVGLKVIEAMEVPRLRLLVEGPGLGLLAREDRALMPIRRLLCTPDVPVAIRRIRAASGRDKPRMLVRGVVDDQIEDDPNAALPRRSGQVREVTEAAQCRVDAVVVADVVATVAPGTGMDRIQPQARDSQSGQVVKATDQSPQVASTVTVRVLERRHVEAVDNGLLIPPAGHEHPTFLLRTTYPMAVSRHYVRVRPAALETRY